MFITTKDVIDEVLKNKHGDRHVFSDVTEIFRYSLYDKINRICKQNDYSVSASLHGWEINAKSMCGRTMITLIAPDKDWMTFIGASDSNSCGWHGCYHEDGLTMKWFDFADFLNMVPAEDLADFFVHNHSLSIH